MNINSNVTVESIVDMCLDIFYWAFKRSRDLRETMPEEVENDVLFQHYYEVGKMEGFNEAMGSILLPIIGGQEMYDVWQRAIEGTKDEEAAGE